MLAYLGFDFEGQEHCGIDDAKNIARILMQLAQDGCKINLNSHIKKSLSKIEKKPTCYNNFKKINDLNKEENSNSSSSQEENKE